MNKHDYTEESLALHKHLKEKLEVIAITPIDTKDDFSEVYSPGVAAPGIRGQSTTNTWRHEVRSRRSHSLLSAFA